MPFSVCNANNQLTTTEVLASLQAGPILHIKTFQICRLYIYNHFIYSLSVKFCAFRLHFTPGPRRNDALHDALREIQVVPRSWLLPKMSFFARKIAANCFNFSCSSRSMSASGADWETRLQCHPSSAFSLSWSLIRDSLSSRHSSVQCDQRCNVRCQYYSTPEFRTVRSSRYA